MRVGLPLLLLPLAASAQDPTDEELRALEASLAADREPAPRVSGGTGGGGLGGLDIALVVDVAGAWFDGEPMQVGAHDPARTGFNLQQVEMTLGANVDHVLRFDANLVFAEFGVEVEEAYGTTLSLPGGLQLRAGQFLTRFGRLNPTHPHAWSFVDQPLVNGKFLGGEGSRGLGVELSWLTPLPWYVELVGSATNAHGACCARSFFGADDPGIDGPEHLLYTTALRQFFDLGPAWGLQWGLAAQLGPNPTGNGNRTEIFGSDLYLRWRPPVSSSRTSVSLTVEAMHRRRQVSGEVLVDTGGYAQVAWRIDPRWELGARYDHVEGLADDPLDPAWTRARGRASLAATLYPSHFSRLRLQGNRDDAGWLDDPVWGVFLALELLVGSHGAHGY